MELMILLWSGSMVVLDVLQCLDSCRNTGLSSWTMDLLISEPIHIHGTTSPTCCTLNSPQESDTHTVMIPHILGNVTSMMINQLKTIFILCFNGLKNTQIIKTKVCTSLESHMLGYMCHTCLIKLLNIMKSMKMIQVFSNRT